jgi:hypothetical protein
VVFFYEILFVVVAVAAVVIGERWSRTLALGFLLVWWAIAVLGYASFGARLASSTADLTDEEEKRWSRDARDGLRHLRLLLGLASAAALIWRLVAGS